MWLFNLISIADPKGFLSEYIPVKMKVCEFNFVMVVKLSLLCSSGLLLRKLAFRGTPSRGHCFWQPKRQQALTSGSLKTMLVKNIVAVASRIQQGVCRYRF